ncbi:MAG TPA: M1 family aminopeptidase, partial [Pyrinomonadaceae bacterium]
MHYQYLSRVFTFRLVLTALALAAFAQSPAAQTATKANGDSLYQQLRQKSNSPDSFSGQVATVSGLVLKRDAATFKFNSGEIYFLAPVEGRTVGAVFLGDVEMTLSPPTEVEKRSLGILTEKPEFVEHFSRLVMRFTDHTFDEIKKAPGVQMTASGAGAVRAREAYRDIESQLRKQWLYNAELRALGDSYDSEAPGFFMAFPGGGRFDKLAYVMDPQGIPEVVPEEVALFSRSDTAYGIWAAFHLEDEYQKGAAISSQERRVYDISKHEIDCIIRGTRLVVSDKISLRTLAKARVLTFDLFGTLRVSQVTDDQGRELSFVQEAKDEDADFGVILPQSVDSGAEIKLTVKYDGEDALKDSGGGNFILLPRDTWYPNNPNTAAGDRAVFDLTFHYPKDNIFVGTGALVGTETLEGDLKVSKWSSGTTELPVTGFNYGKFKKKDLIDKETGLGLEFYANKEVPDELKAFQIFLDELARDKVHITGITGNVSTTSMADYALNDMQNSTRIYGAYFGKLPYTRIAITQQPVLNFGQGWPTLIYMPYSAFMDSTQRAQLLGTDQGADSFWKYVGPHEISHQWWGNVVSWRSYRDQWMSEGFAEFSTSLYAQYVRQDMTKFTGFWDDQRKQITQATPRTKGRKPYMVGPVTQGFRLNTGKTPGVYSSLVYPKGAYVLHMLRMMMFDHKGGGDGRFREMMKDFVQTNYNK